MNLMEQLPARCLQDSWSILYKNLAGCVLEQYGKRGEAAIRKAVHLCGEKMGRLEREEQAAQGRRSNLLGCFSYPQALCRDPRFHVKWRLLNEQEAVFDVFACPIRELLSEDGGDKALLFFCEEYLHGCVMGYTENAGQCCFSEDFAFPGERSCRFSCYFRPANLPPAARTIYFSGECAPDLAEPETGGPDPDAKKRFARWASILLDAFRSECAAGLGHESVCSVASGLRAAAEETVSYCRSLCAMTHRSFDRSFAEQDFLWDMPPCANEELSRETAALVEVNYCRTLWAALDGR